MIKDSIKKGLISIILLLAILSPCYSAQKLPQLADIDHIEISSSELHSIVITEPEKLLEIIAFFNQFQNNWAITTDSLPDADMIFTFHSEQDTISEIGIYNNGISRTYGKFWTQAIPKNIIKIFAGGVHAAIEETLFPIIPIKYDEENIFSYWQHQLNDLKQGASHSEIKTFIKKHKFQIMHVNNYKPEAGYWLKLKLSLINDGEHVDTVLAAKLILNKDHSLKETQFLGYQLSKKPGQKKIITTNINAFSY